jgi:hypothetical protein
MCPVCSGTQSGLWYYSKLQIAHGANTSDYTLFPADLQNLFPNLPVPDISTTADTLMDTLVDYLPVTGTAYFEGTRMQRIILDPASQ